MQVLHQNLIAFVSANDQVVFKYPKKQQIENTSIEASIPKLQTSVMQMSQSTAQQQNQLSTVREFSDIKIMQEYSPAEKTETNNSVMLEQSLSHDLRIWEKLCDVDESVIGEVESGFVAIDTAIQQLAAQFEVCCSLQSKADGRVQEFWRVVRGSVCTKFSRRNPKKTMSRVVYYCPYSEALCWRQANVRSAKPNQMIPIASILRISTTRKANGCYLGVEAQRGVKLELLAPDEAQRNMMVRVLEQLVDGRGSLLFDSNFLMTQYGHDVNQLRRNLDTTKRYFQLTIEKLKHSFVSTAQIIMQQERQKRTQLKREQKQTVKQNKTTLQELIQDNQQLRGLLKANNGNSSQMFQLNQVLNSIVGLNGEHSRVATNTSPFQDSLTLLEQIRFMMEQYQQREQDCQQQTREIINERNELIQANEYLESRLDEVNEQIELREKQFNGVVREMKALQVRVQTMIHQNENKDTTRLVASLCGILCIVCVPDQLNQQPDTLLQNLRSHLSAQYDTMTAQLLSNFQKRDTFLEYFSQSIRGCFYIYINSLVKNALQQDHNKAKKSISQQSSQLSLLSPRQTQINIDYIKSPTNTNMVRGQNQQSINHMQSPTGINQVGIYQKRKSIF